MRWSTVAGSSSGLVVCPWPQPCPHSYESKHFAEILISFDPGWGSGLGLRVVGSPRPQLRHIRSGGMTSLPPTAPSNSASGGGRRSRSRRLLLVGAALAAAGAAGAAYKRLCARRRVGDAGPSDGSLSLGWGEGVSRPEHQIVRTPDGAQLAVWDLAGNGPDAPVVVLPHCWGCSHEIWLPVARRLREQGARVVLYDQRGHGASTRGTAPLEIETLAHDLADVLEATDVHDAVLAGHSMGGMTIMSLATHRPDVLKERARATVLVSTAATSLGDRSAQGARVAGAMVASPVVTRAMRARNGHVFVRFGVRRQPGAGPHGSDPRPLRGLPPDRAGRLPAVAGDDESLGGRGDDRCADDGHGGHTRRPDPAR